MSKRSVSAPTTLLTPRGGAPPLSGTITIGCNEAFTSAGGIGFQRGKMNCGIGNIDEARRVVEIQVSHNDVTDIAGLVAEDAKLSDSRLRRIEPNTINSTEERAERACSLGGVSGYRAGIDQNNAGLGFKHKAMTGEGCRSEAGRSAVEQGTAVRLHGAAIEMVDTSDRGHGGATQALTGRFRGVWARRWQWMWLAALAGCGGVGERYVGSIIPEVPTEVCQERRASLQVRGENARFVLDDGAQILEGSATATGAVSAMRETNGATGRFRQVFEGQIAERRVTGRFGSPRCRAGVELQRE